MTYIQHLDIERLIFLTINIFKMPKNCLLDAVGFYGQINV